jgi:RND family efflux transporter MFP subunit
VSSARRGALAAAVALALAACGQEPSPPVPDQPGPDLATVTVAPEPVAEEIVLDATLEAVNQSTVAAQTQGRVEELPYDVGDYVEKGAVIVRFRGKEQAARLSTAEANAREARARLDEAQAEHARVKNVFERGLVARAALDKAEAGLASARARHEAAQAAADEAREGAGHTVVRAPYAGIVVKRHIEVGETATVGRPLMTGLSLEHLRAVVEVPQHLIAPLRTKRPARVLMPDGRSVPAASLRISPQADTTTHTFHVHVLLAEGQHGGHPGMLVKVAFVSGEHQALLLPAAAVVRRSEVTGAYVVGADGRVTLRYLRLGTPLADGRVPVLSGLEAGERVALDPIAAGAVLKRQAAAT